MADVIAFPRKAPAAVHHLLVAQPNENQPLTITVEGALAASIRRAAAWAGRAPDEQARAFLATGFGGDAA
jgi:hypothetical protein